MVGKAFKGIKLCPLLFNIILIIDEHYVVLKCMHKLWEDA